MRQDLGRQCHRISPANKTGFFSRQRNFNGERLWARGYAVSTVGFETAQIRAYIKQQEQLDGIEGHQEEGSF